MGADDPPRRLQVGAEPVAATPDGPRVVGVLPDVPAIDKVFDYLVPASMDADVRIGTMVRVALHGRRVGGWVVAEREAAPEGVRLLAISKVRGWGPPPDVVDLTRWAARRWAGRPANFLTTASPDNAVRGLPSPRTSRFTVTEAVAPSLEIPLQTAFAAGNAVLQLPPAAHLEPVLLAACALGPALILFPSVERADRAARRLRAVGVDVAVVPRDWARARGGANAVIGARRAAWAPVPDLAAVVVVDGHDEGYQGEAAPTWHARDVVTERARRAGVPVVITSPCPDLETLVGRTLVTVDRVVERAGWPALDVFDRRTDDPRSGLFSPRLVPILRSERRVLCILNRKGRARLLACAACNEVARCTRCDAAVSVAEDDAHLACPRCGDVRPRLCAACGAQRLKVLRAGVARVREELEALAGRPVQEITGESKEAPSADVVVGTEALLHRATRADTVVFLDFDQELLASRYRSAEQALALLARAARLAGGRESSGRVVVQTRIPDHMVLNAARHGDPARLVAVESARRRDIDFPPFAALALVSGDHAEEFVAGLEGVHVLGPASGKWMAKARDHETLARALAGVARPAGRLRVEVDPLRI